MDWQGWKCTVEERIFESPIMQILNPVRNRITVAQKMGWDKILQVVSNSKLSITPTSERYGGPPAEAGAYGIPYVTDDRPTMFGMFTDRLCASSMQERLAIYDRLMDEHTFYRQSGDSYRKFIQTHHTYDAFIRNLFRILSERGIS